MAEKRPENSVLFSLKELRNIEDDRVREEDAQKQARLEAERQAKLEAERQTREAEAAKIREAEEKVAREKREREHHEREGQLRLQEAETRAQIEARERLERARIEAEAHAKIHSKPFPTAKVVGGVIALLVMFGIGATMLVQNKNEEAARQRLEAAEKFKAERAAIEQKNAAEKAALMADITRLTGDLANATDDAKRKAISDQLNAARRRAGIKEPVAAGPTAPAVTHMDTSGTDPLAGIETGGEKKSHGGKGVAKKGGKAKSPKGSSSSTKSSSPEPVGLPGF
jgi:colicin import membrane protein